MKRIAILLLLFGSAATSGDVRPASDDIACVESLQNGKYRVWRISDAALSYGKRWNPATEPPPLSIADAIMVAQRESAADSPQAFSVTRIEISSRLVNDTLRWFYKISGYDKRRLSGELPPPIESVIVLMSGKVVRPTEENVDPFR